MTLPVVTKTLGRGPLTPSAILTCICCVSILPEGNTHFLQNPWGLHQSVTSESITNSLGLLPWVSFVFCVFFRHQILIRIWSEIPKS